MFKLKLSHCNLNLLLVLFMMGMENRLFSSLESSRGVYKCVPFCTETSGESLRTLQSHSCVLPM